MVPKVAVELWFLLLIRVSVSSGIGTSRFWMGLPSASVPSTAFRRNRNASVPFHSLPVRVFRTLNSG